MPDPRVDLEPALEATVAQPVGPAMRSADFVTWDTARAEALSWAEAGKRIADQAATRAEAVRRTV